MEEMQLSYLLKIVNDNFERELNNKTAAFGLTSSQCKMLGYLYRNQDKEINPIDIEKNFRLQKPTITGILQRLVEKDLIHFENSAKDKRYKQIVLTEKAKSFDIVLKQSLNESEEILYQGITKEEKEEVRKILEKMLKNLTEKGISNNA